MAFWTDKKFLVLHYVLRGTDSEQNGMLVCVVIVGQIEFYPTPSTFQNLQVLDKTLIRLNKNLPKFR